MIYLYEKIHTKTGLKYFGKTKKDPETYLGSGVFWRRHINKYGTEYVINNILWSFESEEEAKAFAENYSIENDIVNSKQYANLIPEYLTGGDTSMTKAWRIGMSKRVQTFFAHSDETKEKLRKPKKSKENYKNHRPPSSKGKVYINNGIEQHRILPEEVSKYEGYVIGKLKLHCSKCDKWADKQNFARWHAEC
tara:strand:+ start:3902 stop:4480 length:579 start_codon:yes stop_codon:yes gene_type:complete